MTQLAKVFQNGRSQANRWDNFFNRLDEVYSPKLMKIVSAFIDNFIIYDYSKFSAQSYANIRTDLEKKGRL